MARRRLLFGLLASVALIAIRVGDSLEGEEVVRRVAPSLSAPPRIANAELFPRYRVVALAGAPQPAQVTRQARAYVKPGQPVIPAFEITAVTASKRPGADGAFRTRQSTATIQRYLEAARRARAMLILDVQPGHSSFMTEAKLLEPFLEQPDVGLALDPKWNVPLGVVPGEAPGSVPATDVNDIAEYLDGIVSANDLPQKLLLVHASTESMVLPKFALRALPNVAESFVVDGATSAAGTQARYAKLTETLNPGLAPGLSFGSSTGLTAGEVSALSPAPKVVVHR
jgi:hypothetical protein